MSESHGTEDEQEESGAFDVEENREEEGSGYGASEQGDAGVEGAGDQSGMGELEDKDENWAD
jgi:hypothetical protein